MLQKGIIVFLFENTPEMKCILCVCTNLANPPHPGHSTVAVYMGF